jgi:hypothetical protein
MRNGGCDRLMISIPKDGRIALADWRCFQDMLVRLKPRGTNATRMRWRELGLA